MAFNFEVDSALRTAMISQPMAGRSETFQIVIDVPMVCYERICSTPVYRLNELQCLIKNGTVLPKKHGRIGDIDDLLGILIFSKSINDNVLCGTLKKAVDSVTILEGREE